MKILETKNLEKSYNRGDTKLLAVSDVNINLNQGEVLLVMGPSGSGKTTLLSMLGILLKPTQGKVFIDGENVFNLNKTMVSRFRLQKIGFVFQSFNLISALTAVENVELPALLLGKSKKEARKKALKLMKDLGIEKRATHLPKHLSGGEQQRVSVARALINDPSIILADEPTGNLDSKSGHDVMELLCSVSCNQKKGVLIVTHDLRIKEIADRILYFEDGKITKEEVIKRDGLKLGQKTKLNNK